MKTRFGDIHTGLRVRRIALRGMKKLSISIGVVG